MPKIGKRLKSVRERLGDVTEERSAGRCSKFIERADVSEI